MAMVIDTTGLSTSVEIDEDRAGTSMQKAIGGPGYIVAVAPNSMAAKEGYSYSCFPTGAKDAPENRRATIWMGRSSVRGKVVFLNGDELYDLSGETKPEQIEKSLNLNRSR